MAPRDIIMRRRRTVQSARRGGLVFEDYVWRISAGFEDTMREAMHNLAQARLAQEVWVVHHYGAGSNSTVDHGLPQDNHASSPTPHRRDGQGGQSRQLLLIEEGFDQQPSGAPQTAHSHSSSPGTEPDAEGSREDTGEVLPFPQSPACHLVLAYVVQSLEARHSWWPHLHAFVDGAATLVQLLPAPSSGDMERFSRVFEITADDSLACDWYVTGDDLRKALQAFRKEMAPNDTERTET